MLISLRNLKIVFLFPHMLAILFSKNEFSSWCNLSSADSDISIIHSFSAVPTLSNTTGGLTYIQLVMKTKSINYTEIPLEP